MGETAVIWFVWSVLIAVLLAIALGKASMDLAAGAGLLVLGLFQTAPLSTLFSGFGHPALITIVAVMVMSEGIYASGVFSGLGLMIAKRTRNIEGQIITASLLTSFLSAFMNNVGAVGLVLHTAVRMADRANIHRSVFGMTIAMAGILGGTLTLIGSAPNIIVSSYMHSMTGQRFLMFDFFPQGLAILVVFVLLWKISIKLGVSPMQKPPARKGDETDHASPEPPSNPGLFATPRRKKAVAISAVGIFFVSMGMISPALGFATVVLLFIFFRVITKEEAFQGIDLSIVIFLGSMIGIGQGLEHVGGLEKLSAWLIPVVSDLSPQILILSILFVAAALANAINNAAAAVVMAPIAFSLASQTVSVSVPALLMAVAVGSNLALILPTHQAALLAMSKAPFSVSSYMRTGFVLTAAAGLAAAVVIFHVWN